MDVKVRSEGRTEEEAERGSSEETLECVSNVSTKLFSDIASCRLVKQRLIEGWDKGDQITGIVQLSNGKLVVVVRSECGYDKYLKILDETFETKLDFDMRSQYQNVHIDESKIKIALFDGNRVATLISCRMLRKEIHELVNIIHLISVDPYMVGAEIKLKYTCEHIACSNNKIYCYSPDLRRSTMISCPGVEILSINGEVLKTIQLFDQVSCFCPTKDGGIVYFGSRKVDGRTKDVFRCVTEDSVEVFSHTNAEKPINVIADIAGNIIVLNSFGNIVLLTPDGSQKRGLLKQSDMEITGQDTCSFGPGWVGLRKESISRYITSMCFSDDYKIILVACRLGINGFDDTRPKLYMYALQNQNQP